MPSNTTPSSALATAALEAFDSALARLPGMRSRPGQRAMATCVAETFGTAAQAEHASQDGVRSKFSVVEAGTGTGKTFAYTVPAIIAALERKTRLIISTGTVALQEQLVAKDLPLIASALDRPFEFVLAKGRSRYVCPLKLQRVASNGQAQDDDTDLFSIALDEPGDQGNADGHNTAASSNAAERSKAQGWLDGLTNGTWNGEMDTLTEPPDPAMWSRMAAERHSCTSRHCQHYQTCPFFEARRAIAKSDVIVVNHDLLLSAQASNLLPDLSTALLVVDEAHNLPQTAVAQFSCSMNVSNLRWIGQLANRLQQAHAALKLGPPAQAVQDLRALKEAMGRLQGHAMELFDLSHPKGTEPVVFAGGHVPAALHGPLHELISPAKVLCTTLQDLSNTLAELIRSDHAEKVTYTAHYTSLGALAPRVAAVLECAEMMLAQETVPNAKWATLESVGGYFTCNLHACPLSPGPLLERHLWRRARQVVLTSATLTSCANFDYFLSESGLDVMAGTETLQVSSPFDYATQGKLVIRATNAGPKQVDAFEAEFVENLLSDLRDVTSGALVLFTSRRQMQLAEKALDDALRGRVLVQGSTSRFKLLETHRMRVDSGHPSIIFGMQSFGEGLDLPGRYCEHLHIAKLPFTPPTDPVAQSRAAWLDKNGGDSFNDLVVPQTALKLCQWMGRAIRTETDHSTIYCHDKRLTTTPYGRRMLRGLPAFRLDDSPVTARG